MFENIVVELKKSVKLIMCSEIYLKYLTLLYSVAAKCLFKIILKNVLQYLLKASERYPVNTQF